MPLFIGNVWKVCAQPAVMSRRDTIRALEPAPEMALIGKTKRGGYHHRLFASPKQLTGFCQPQLNQPRVRGKMELPLKTAGQRKAICTRFPREIRKTDVVTDMRIKVIPRTMRHRRTLQL